MDGFSRVENLDDSHQFNLGRDFFTNFDLTIDMNSGLNRIKNPDRKYLKEPINRIKTDGNKIPIFSDRRIKLKAIQTVIATSRLRNLNALSENKQVYLIPKPNSQSAVILGRSFLVTRGGLCLSALLNRTDTSVSIQRRRRLGYALLMKTDRVPKPKKHQVKECPYHANKDSVLGRIDELKLIRIDEMKSYNKI